MSTVFITGSGDGLGFEFCKQYLQSGNKVVATCRTKKSCDKLLKTFDNKNLEVFKLDITKENEVNYVKNNLGNKKIDILINNAGVHGPKDETGSFGHLDINEWLNTININTIAPIKITEALYGNLYEGDEKKIVFISSRAASIKERGQKEYHKPGGPYIYRTSKAALNSAAKNLAFDLTPLGFSIIVLHPGLVKTKINDYNGHISSRLSVMNMMKLISNWKQNYNGSFYAYDGERIPW